jgi:hypothetical protein
MNILTNHELGHIVYMKVDPTKKMMIIGIQVYINFSYKYICTWPTNEGICEGWFFEEELQVEPEYIRKEDE